MYSISNFVRRPSHKIALTAELSPTIDDLPG
jgi:hypothetical protein